MRDYNGLSPEKKIEAGNRWLIRNKIYEIEITLSEGEYCISKRIGNEILLKLPVFEEIIKQIQIEYRLDNSPENQ
ncbi:MAG: hypothetical protein E7411_03500 [Ruminococcaceae bacterium]|nr:hypothetical protein [Oscillospiraceae bacterium]